MSFTYCSSAIEFFWTAKLSTNSSLKILFLCCDFILVKLWSLAFCRFFVYLTKAILSSLPRYFTMGSSLWHDQLWEFHYYKHIRQTNDFKDTRSSDTLYSSLCRRLLITNSLKIQFKIDSLPSCQLCVCTKHCFILWVKYLFKLHWFTGQKQPIPLKMVTYKALQKAQKYCLWLLGNKETAFLISLGQNFSEI